MAFVGNRMQRAVNLIFGAALSTIALTVPAVLAISMVTGKPVELGLSAVNQIMLAAPFNVHSDLYNGAHERAQRVDPCSPFRRLLHSSL